MKTNRSQILAALLALAFATLRAPAQTPATVTVDPKNPGAAIPEDFSGLSFEVSLLLPDPATGKHYFRPDNQPLLNVFHTLGIRSLRIGGNTSDRDVRQLPTDADFDSLFTFAKAAKVKVIYCLRLHNGDPEVDARTVKYLTDHYAQQIECFSIGQEPSAYPVEKVDTRPASERMGGAAEKYTYAEYHDEWKRFADVIIAAVPGVKLCGPCVHNNAEWARRFMTDFGQSNHVGMIMEHLYPGGAGGKVPSPEIGRDRMLSDDFVKTYQKLHDGFVPMAVSNGLPYRLEEVNNYFNGGAADVSPTFAAALWGLDFMHWWAAHEAAGLNFHTGDRVAAGSTLQPSKYTAFFSSTNGYLVRPLGYGIKAFELGSHGRLVPAAVTASNELNLTAYGVLGNDHALYVTLINKEHGTNAQAAIVTLAPGASYAKAEAVVLTAPGVTATDGVTLGGSGIKTDASWNGKWAALAKPAKDGSFTVNLPASTAVVVKLR